MEFVPKWIAWESTERCNLSCIHCRCSSDMEKDLFHLDTQRALQLVDRIAELCQPVFVLSGGEPLMREDIFDIARYADGKGFRVCMATNGALLTDDICEQMKQTNIRMVSLSLDGSSAEVHDNFRQVPGSFDAVMRAAELLNQHQIPFLINSSFTQRNQEDIAATFRLAKGLGARAWYMFMIVPTGRGEDVMAELVKPEDYNEILRWHYEQEKQEDKILMRPTCAPHYYRMVPQLNKQSDDKLERRSLTFSTGGAKGCIAAQSICFIDARGNVKPCSYLPLTAGNILETPFKAIWEESQLFQDMRDFKAYKGRCGACEYVNVCGGCRARAYSVTGDYMEEEPFCDYVPLSMGHSS